MRHWLRRLHLWFGLSVGLVFALIALSGTALVYEHPLQAWLYPQLQARDISVPTPAEQAQTLARLTAGPARNTLRSIGLPSDATPYWQLSRNDRSRQYLDAHTGKLFLTRDSNTDPMVALHRFHARLLAGANGNALIRILGFAALFLLLSGVVLWWPGKSRLRHSVRPFLQPPTRRWVSWHRSTGVITLPLLLVITVTGTWLTYRGERPRAAPAHATLSVTHAERAVNWASVLARAQQAAPDARLSSVSMPSPRNARISVRATQPGAGRINITLDPYSAQPARIAAQTRRANSVMGFIHGLHAGRIGGLPWELLTALSGLLPLFFLVTGFLFWRTRTRARRRPTHHAAPAFPPSPGPTKDRRCRPSP